MADVSKLRVVQGLTILNKMAQIYKEEMGLVMTYTIEFDDPDDPVVVINIVCPEFHGVYRAGIKLVTITNLCTNKKPNDVAEDLTTNILSDLTNLFLKEILK